jgi:hypothetical protein
LFLEEEEKQKMLSIGIWWIGKRLDSTHSRPAKWHLWLSLSLCVFIFRMSFYVHVFFFSYLTFESPARLGHSNVWLFQSGGRLALVLPEADLFVDTFGSLTTL